MAIFERENVQKVILDDTQPLHCTIENWRTVNGHTEFVIRVHRGPFLNKHWLIYKRYNDFYKLHNHLAISGAALDLPPKKLIGNMDPAFIMQRLKSLQIYLNTVVMNPILVSSLPARSFIDPANYCQPFGELALQHVTTALRCEVGWEVVGPVEEMGWRLRKHYYQIRGKSAPKSEFLAGWTDYGPDKYLDDKDMHAVFKCLPQIQHPFIHSIDLAVCSEVGGLVARTNHKDGSLRDLICGAKPRHSFLKKYGNPKGHKALEPSLVALYGRQMLEALKFLHDKGLPYGHLHTGNVFIQNERIKLMDIENGVLGVPSFYRPYFMQHRKINTLHAIDVYCFGHTLYEMTFGAPLHESVADKIPPCSSPLLKTILESILSSESCKSGLPSVEALIQHKFFSTVALNLLPEDKTYLKIPTSTKERLKNVKIQLEERLKDEQKMIRSQKRLVKVQEMMSSEEEKKKQRHKIKQEQKLKERQKSKQENGGERSDSVNSSATTSQGTSTPPTLPIGGGSSIPPPPAPPAPPPPPPLNGESNNCFEVVTKDRSALLGAICNFNKNSLKKTKVN